MRRRAHGELPAAIWLPVSSACCRRHKHALHVDGFVQLHRISVVRATGITGVATKRRAHKRSKLRKRSHKRRARAVGTEAAREMLFRAAAFVSRDKNRKIKIFNFLILRFTNKCGTCHERSPQSTKTVPTTEQLVAPGSCVLPCSNDLSYVVQHFPYPR